MCWPKGSPCQPFAVGAAAVLIDAVLIDAVLIDAVLIDAVLIDGRSVSVLMRFIVDQPGVADIGDALHRPHVRSGIGDGKFTQAKWPRDLSDSERA